MVFWQVATEVDKLADALAQAGDAVIGAACDNDETARNDPLYRLSDPVFVLPAMAAGEHQRTAKPRPLRVR